MGGFTNRSIGSIVLPIKGSIVGDIDGDVNETNMEAELGSTVTMAVELDTTVSYAIEL